MNMMIIDDEPIVGKRLKRVLGKENFHIEVFSDSERAKEELERKHFDIVITDLKMKKTDGMKILEAAKRKNPLTHVIIITGFGTSATAAEAFEKQAFDFITKPFKMEELKNVIQRARNDIMHRKDNAL